jgi:hypothetical protein
VADKPSISLLFLGPGGLIRASPLLKNFVVSVFKPVADAGRSGLSTVGSADQLFDGGVLVLGLDVC